MGLFGNDDNKILELDRRQTESIRHRYIVEARDKIRTMHSTLRSRLSEGRLAESIISIRRDLEGIQDKNLLATISESVNVAYRNNALPTSVRLFGRDLRRDYKDYLRAATQCVNQVLVEQQRNSTVNELQTYLDQADDYLRRLEQIEVAIRQYEERVFKEKVA